MDGEEAPETALAVCPHGQGEDVSRGERHPLWPGRVEGFQLRVKWPRMVRGDTAMAQDPRRPTSQLGFFSRRWKIRAS